MPKDEYVKMILDFLNKDDKTSDEYMHFYNALTYGALFDGDREFKRFQFELEDLSEEFEYSMYVEDMKKYDDKLIEIMKKYGYM